MGNTRFNEHNTPNNQSIIDSLYKIFAMTTASSNALEHFEAIMKIKPSITHQKSHRANLKEELTNIIECLEYFEHSQSPLHFNVNVKNTFSLLEKIILRLNASVFNQEVFDDLNMVIHKLAICFSKHHSLEHRKDWQDMILKHGRLIALVHNVFINKLNDVSKNLAQRLEKNEKENARINDRIVHLEKATEKQLKAINHAVSTINAAPFGRKN